jgi:Tfp pilus tip-associated adhesin PilY1
MRTLKLSRFATAAVSCALVFCSFQASPEDIDIFSVDENSNVNNPNVLFVVDNSANWARQSQQWPAVSAGGQPEDQGQSEVDAISTVIQDLDDGINVGLMEFITEGAAASQDSAYLRYHIRPMTDANKAALTAVFAKIYGDINAPIEKRPSSNPFGNLFWDVYNYLGSFQASQKGDGTPSLADPAAYDSPYDDFRSPLTSNDTCARTIVIFIGNNVSTGPSPDSADNVAALLALATDANGTDAGNLAVSQISFADYVVTTSTASTNIDYSTACYASAAACSTAENSTTCTDEGFLSCSCNATAPIACPSTHWAVTGTHSEIKNASDDTQDFDKTYTGETTFCRNTTPPGACTLPPGTTTVVSPDTPNVGETTTTETSWVGACSYSDTGVACGSGKTTWQPVGTKRVRTIVDVVDTQTSMLGETTACYVNQAGCNPADGAWNCADYSQGCTCTTIGDTAGCPAGNTSRFMVQGNYQVTAASQTGTFSAAPTGPFMMDEWARFLRQTGVPIPGLLNENGEQIRSQVTTYTIDVFNAQQHPDFSGLLFNAARVGGGKYFQAKDKNSLINALRQILTEVQAVNSAFSSASLPVNATNRAQNENQVFIGVFKPDRTKDPGWFGNMKQYKLISTGASIDLGDSLNQPAINNETGFLTDCAVSFWTRNSGTYWQTAITDDPDALSICATNSTSDWSDLPDGPFVEKGAAAEVVRRGNTTGSPDIDGNYTVERTVYTEFKGVLEELTIDNFDDGNADTLNDGAASTDEEAEALVVRFMRGEDIRDEDGDAKDLTLFPDDRGQIEPRSTIHGDVVHSRPQPINYAKPGDPASDVVVFYGANDGHFRAVKALTGQELWSFVAPQSFTKIQRLFDNAPAIRYFGDSAVLSEPKSYFFDGSTGVFQTEDNSKIWIYPTLRRGGNRLYGLDVTNQTMPVYMWSAGCDGTACGDGAGAFSDEFKAMGQTWALPNVAFIKGYCGASACVDDTTPRKPVIVLAGGYDACEDQNTWTPSCSGTTGAGVYVLDAETGTLIRHFDFSALTGFAARSVTADVALIDVDSDERVDYGYAVDTGGNIYRFDFIEDPVSKTAIDDPTKWPYSRVAFTNGQGRKFLFPPALVQVTASKIYLAIGTGDREHPLRTHYPYEDRNGDKDTTDGGVVNRFYVFKDDLTNVDATSELDLDGGTMSDYTKGSDCSTAPVLPTSVADGWFIDLTEQGKGEQVVTSAVVAAGFVFFSTNRPTETAETVCTSSLGEARGYFMNLLNSSGAIGVAGACGGTRSSTFVGGGLPPSPVLATVPIDGELRTVVIGAVQKTGEPSSPIQSQRVRPPIASDRKPIYWYKSTGDK